MTSHSQCEDWEFDSSRRVRRNQPASRLTTHRLADLLQLPHHVGAIFWRDRHEQRDKLIGLIVLRDNAEIWRCTAPAQTARRWAPFAFS